MTSHFDSPHEVLGWTHEAIEELAAACARFLHADNFASLTEYDAKAGEYIHKVVFSGKVTPAIRRKLTEALSNVRHSFDQSLFAACVAIGRRPKTDTYFPWANDPTDLEYRIGARSRPGKSPPNKVPAELWPVLRGLEPYGRGNGYSGGDDLVRELAKIANRKHTASLSCRGSVQGLSSARISVSGGRAGILMPRWDAVNNEIVLARTGSETKLDYNYTLHTEVVFDEPGPLNGVPVVAALAHFKEKAQGVLEALEREASRIAGA